MSLSSFFLCTHPFKDHITTPLFVEHLVITATMVHDRREWSSERTHGQIYWLLTQIAEIKRQQWETKDGQQYPLCGGQMVMKCHLFLLTFT